MEYEAVIGLEVHIQLNTETKIFTSASAHFGDEPNENIDPLILGLPGTLPVVNGKVIDAAIRMGLATNCEIRNFNRFARKHYFYPDLPKGYQISQFTQPICERGRIEIKVKEANRSIGITRIHMEEDAGKTIHDGKAKASLVDLNRAGVPLLEVVSEPDLRSPAEASIYLKSLRQIARYLEISDGNMEEGSLRCDANISLRPVGELKFGTRTEIKNINSFRFVEKALEYEIARQLKIIKSGEKVVQETRLFDSDSGTTHPMRGKEESADYRYFPDPDLPPIKIEESRVREIRSSMPKMPWEVEEHLVQTYGLTQYDAEVLCAEKIYVDFFKEALEETGNARVVCNWITSELFGLLNKDNIDFQEIKFQAKDLGALVELIETDVVSGKMAKKVFEEMYESGKSPKTIVDEQGLRQITNPEELRPIVEQVLADNGEQVNKYKAGDKKLHGYFVGQVMKQTGGSANPKLVNTLLKQLLDE